MSKNYKVNIMKILVTGFSGFIGKHLLERLNQTNHELILMDLAMGLIYVTGSKLSKLKT